MKNKLCAFLTLALLATLNSQLSTLHAQGTAFTYQGRINDGSVPANGTYDLQFTLFNVSSGVGTVAGPLTNAATAISNGLFTVALDFGANFPGADRWLEIAARTNGAGAFTTLIPRQKITAVPYAIMANSASNLLGMLPASQLSGTLPSSQLAGPYSGAVTLSNAANSFSGSGASLSSLNADNISSGTLNDARLSGNVALLNANQTFTGVNTFNNSASSFTGSFTGNAVGLTNVNLLTAIPHWAITLTTNFVSVGTFGFTIASGPVVGNGPQSVAAADVNGDGKLDLISANIIDDTLTVLTNNGSGVFVPASTPTVGNGPQSVAVADVNGDGKVDLISANDFADTLTVLTNNGSGGFALRSSPSVGAAPTSVAAADVNGDGKVDLISANGDANTLTVLTNNGSGGFGLRSSPSVGVEPYSVVAVDVNGDTTVDLITANFGTNRLSVMLNNGSGVFSLSSSPIVGNGPISVAAADVNGDGKVDLISANFGPDTLSVLTNNGSGTFGSNATLTVGSGPYSVVAADVNTDGKVDLISANVGPDTLTVLTNNGIGGFVIALSSGVGNYPQSVVAADVNGDGSMDLISANELDDTLTVLFNTLSLSNITTTATIQGNFTGPTLTIQGDLTSGRVLLDSGSASLPGFAFVGDQNTGIFRPSANTLAVTTLGAERLRVTSTGDVGIGTTTPEAPLHVAEGSAGTVTANASSIAVLEKSGDGYLSLLTPSANDSGILFGNPNSSTDGGIIFNNALSRLQFRTGTNSTKMTILADGNVGIGTTSPTNKLHVVGGVSATAFVTTSDRSAKENFAAVSPGDVLAKVAALPISTWNFKEMRDGRHMGPMAQDFYAAFGLGGSDTTITTVDPDGVALAAIQGLNQKLEETRAENAELKQRLEKLERLVTHQAGGEK